MALHSTGVVDEFNAGMALAIITMASPVVIYLVLTGLPSAIAVDQTFNQPHPEALEKMSDIGSPQGMPDYMDGVDFKGNDPEQALQIAYENSARSEADRCLGQSSNKDLCEDVMTLLIDSCADSSMHVAACDDPRLAKYRASNLDN